MNIAYFKRHQCIGIHTYYKVFGGPGKTMNGFQEVINFFNHGPLISIEENFVKDPSGITGTWSQYEAGISISKEEYDSILNEAN